MSNKPVIARLDSQSPDFQSLLEQLVQWDSISDKKITTTVESILADVRQRGDAAVLEYTNRFDRRDLKTMEEINAVYSDTDNTGLLAESLATITDEQRDALNIAAARIKTFARRQKMESWSYVEDDGTMLGQKITALDRVGLYVPGGKAAYPSSVLMNAIPAAVAGVKEVIMVVPAPDGVVNKLVMAAAAIAGVSRVVQIGGAQAIAALAYGTESIPAVDKIVGPGNIYVATAKRMVFGTVGIDMVAGPSEILVVCDGKTDPDWIAMDLFSQAEHDEDAQAILVSPDADFLNAVEQSIVRQMSGMERSETIKKSLADRGALIKVNDIKQALEVSNFIAPEHLELSVEDPEALIGDVHHAGAIFMGRYTAEALGDYCAGPNHVLPTSRTARFSSSLGVYDFQKRSSLIHCSAQGASELGKTASVLARGEGLTAHAKSAEFRIIK
ncbi:Histidinol dehydrogenase [hydrothermal vent metagenome]|uniref:histidinol dehydrogenase n=1 Tax=hydrothermal vent metagenome TaxID=652676 RepID=A0A3B0YV93_9ZZZZ